MERMCSPRRYAVGTLSYTLGGLIVLFCWLLWGDFAWSLKDRAVGPVATLMVKQFGVSDFFYGVLIISFPNLTNIFLGPVVSYFSDRHRGRMGRRIPFLASTLPFIVLGILGLGFSPQLGSWLSEKLGTEFLSAKGFSLICFSIFWVLFDFGNTLSGIIFTALVVDVVPQHFLGRFFGLFRGVSLFAGVLFNYFLLGYSGSHATLIFTGLAIVYAVGFGTLILKVREGEYPPPEDTGRISWNPLVIFRTYLKECFSNPYYRWVILALPIANMANAPFNAYSIFHAQSLQIDLDNLGRYFAYTYIISLLLSYFLGMLADRFHPIRMGIVSTAAYGLLSLSGYFFIRDELSFSIVFILHGVLAGSFGTLTASYGPRLFPNALFAQFNSAIWLFQSLSWVVVPPLVGMMLDVTGNRYNYALIMGAVFSVFGVFMLSVVLHKYNRLGGDLGYIPPAVE